MMPSAATRPAAIVVLDGMSVLFHSARRLVRLLSGRLSALGADLKVEESG